MISNRLSKTLLAGIGVLATSFSVGISSYLIDKNSIQSDKTITKSDDMAVCYNSSTDIKYTTIEKALGAAKSGQEVFVYPNLRNNDGNLHQIHITSNCIIRSGVTLSLPYSETTYFDSDAHGTGSFTKDGTTYEHTFADESEAGVAYFRKTQVIIDEGVVLTINGTLNIGGVLSNPDRGVSGQTAGDYCEITMDANSEINCYAGTINCYGYIKSGANDDKQSGANAISQSTKPIVTLTNKAILMSPFVIYDFKGGATTLGTINLAGENKFSPFQIFDFCNIQTLVHVDAGSIWKARTCIYIETLDNDPYKKLVDSPYIAVDNLYFIGTEETTGALILRSGYFEVEYKPRTKGFTLADKQENDEFCYSSTSIALSASDGMCEADLGGIVITVKIGNLYEKSIDTSEFYFPISYKLDLTIRKGSTFNVLNKIKLMNGANIIIDNGAKLNLSNEIIIYDEKALATLANDDCYPQKVEEAKLVNNGIIDVNSNGAIGGYVGTSSEGAVLNYTGSSNFYVTSPEYGGTTPTAASALGGTPVSVAQYGANACGYLAYGNLIGEKVFKDNYDIIYSQTYTSIENTNAIPSSFAWSYSEVPIENVTIELIDSGRTEEYGYVILKASPTNSVRSPSYEWELVDDSGETISSVGNVELINSDTDSVTIQNSSSGSIAVNMKVTVKDILGNSVSSVKNNVEVQDKKATTGGQDINSIKLKMDSSKNATENTEDVKYTIDKIKDSGTTKIGEFTLSVTIDPNYEDKSYVLGYTWGINTPSGDKEGDKIADIGDWDHIKNRSGNNPSIEDSGGSYNWKVLKDSKNSFINLKFVANTTTANYTYKVSVAVRYMDKNEDEKTIVPDTVIKIILPKRG